jgi:hypothetical protein
MSFLDGNNSEYLSARLTQKGRRAIANGDFKISYFSIGDSEFVYTTPFSAITGDPINGTNHQGVLAPLDKDSQIKYPLLFDSTNTTQYGIPVTGTTTETLRNAMGPAGFVSEYDIDNDEATIVCLNNPVNFLKISGGTTLLVDIISGTTYSGSEFITLSFDGMNGDIITGNTNAKIYKLVSVSGITSELELLTLDRPLPNLTGLTGDVHVISNKCDIEFPPGDVDMTCLPILPETTEQHNPWTLNVVWSQKPIGFDAGGDDESLSGFTSNKYISTKEFLGYQTTGQTHTTTTGTLLSKPTSYVNSFGEEIEVKSTEQKSIALVHYSETGDIVNDPDRFFKYDDYISMSSGNTITPDDTDDYEYFQVYLPYLQYHRNTGTTIGAIFSAHTQNKLVKSVVNENFTLTYRDLLDENGIKVGKIFTEKKIIVFDDEEIVAALDYKSNRTYTLPAPKVGSIPTDTSGANSVMDGTTGQTLWVTYMLTYTSDNQLNGLPCNYYTKITGTTTPSNITVKFNGGFQFMKTLIDDVKTGFVANKFYILTQMVGNGELPTPNNWDYIDFTTDVSGGGVGLLDPDNLTGVTFTINKTKYDGGTSFDIENFIGLVPDEPSTLPQFGDEQPFPGSVKLVRASDILEMNFLINLPTGKFSTSQNKTYTSGDAKITEVVLLNDSKETMVVAKTAKPIRRVGTQVFAVKLDF